jgi:hypothetical protein
VAVAGLEPLTLGRRGYYAAAATTEQAKISPKSKTYVSSFMMEIDFLSFFSPCGVAAGFKPLNLGSQVTGFTPVLPLLANS